MSYVEKGIEESAELPEFPSDVLILLFSEGKPRSNSTFE